MAMQQCQKCGCFGQPADYGICRYCQYEKRQSSKYIQMLKREDGKVYVDPMFKEEEDAMNKEYVDPDRNKPEKIRRDFDVHRQECAAMATALNELEVEVQKLGTTQDFKVVRERITLIENRMLEALRKRTDVGLNAAAVTNVENAQGDILKRLAYLEKTFKTWVDCKSCHFIDDIMHNSERISRIEQGRTAVSDAKPAERGAKIYSEGDYID